MAPDAFRCTAEHTPDGAHRLRMAGPLRRDAIRLFLRQFHKSPPLSTSTLRLDLQEVTSIDSTGAACLLYLHRQAEREGWHLILEQVPFGIARQLSVFRVSETPAPAPPAPPGPLEALGDTGLAASEAGLSLMVLASDSTAELLSGILHPKRIRWGASVAQMAYIGSQAMGTVGLITYLVGLTLAFQSAHQLRQFGADLYVADLTAVAMMREMGPLMTAILVAGRSGSAIAAEIATMKVSEELDALEVMGIPFTRFLAVPRILAMLAVMPLLVILADLLGILGGMTVGTLYLDLAPGPYITETLSVLGPKDLVMSLSKALVFGWGVVLIALYNGLKVRGGAQEVGSATTSSVVQSLFYIILMDAAFSIIFYVIL